MTANVATAWKPITAKRFELVRDCTMPSAYKSFTRTTNIDQSNVLLLCGEQEGINPETDEKTFTAVAEINGNYYETAAPVTVDEFHRIVTEHIKLDFGLYPVVGPGGAIVGHVADDAPITEASA